MMQTEFQELLALYEINAMAPSKPVSDLIKIEIYSKLIDLASGRGFKVLVEGFREKQSELINQYQEKID